MDQHGVGVGVQLGQRQELGDPAAVHLVRDRQLSGLVVGLDDDVLAEVSEGHFRPQPAADVPHFVGPALELVVVGDSPLEGDGVELGTARRLRAQVGSATASMDDDLGRAFEGTHFAHAGDVPPVPADAELEVLVRIENAAD